MVTNVELLQMLFERGVTPEEYRLTYVSWKTIQAQQNSKEVLPIVKAAQLAFNVKK